MQWNSRRCGNLVYELAFDCTYVVDDWGWNNILTTLQALTTLLMGDIWAFPWRLSSRCRGKPRMQLNMQSHLKCTHTPGEWSPRIGFMRRCAYILYILRQKPELTADSQAFPSRELRAWPLRPKEWSKVVMHYMFARERVPGNKVWTGPGWPIPGHLLHSAWVMILLMLTECFLV